MLVYPPRHAARAGLPECSALHQRALPCAAFESVGDQSSPPDYEEYYQYRDENLSKLGLRAIGQIESLCKTYKIPPPERPKYYAPKEDLISKLERMEEIDKTRAAFSGAVTPLFMRHDDITKD